MNKPIFFLLIIFCFLVPVAACQSHSDLVDRQPAVAGSFYPANPTDLSAMLKQLFAKAEPSRDIKNVIAVISPHAGYVFSGEVAASAMNQIDPARAYDNIFIIGSSHHIAFEGASIYTQGNFITPLGSVKVNSKLAKELINKFSVFSNRTDAHDREHSLEVQLPFLQYRLQKEFSIVPIVLGTQSPETCKQIAEALQPYLNTKNLFVISTDFSHYPPYADAVNVDKATTDAILTNSSQNLLQSLIDVEQKKIPNCATSLCGWTSVLTLLYMTENNPDVQFTHVQYKNSGDSPYGDRKQVVGYNALAISLNKNNARSEFKLNDTDKKELLRIARTTIQQLIQNHKPFEYKDTDASAALKTPCGAFVTLKKHGDLRGCIGRFDARDPLYKVVETMAVASSTQDNRFSPVQADEIPQLEIEISVLTPMRRVKSIDEIELGKHGIYIKKGFRSGTFLPQVATETGWTKEEFLGHCAQDKAGIGWNGWKDAEIYIYEALVFGEKDWEGK